MNLRKLSIHTIFNIGFYLVATGLFSYHLYMVMTHSVDVPWHDTWNFFTDRGLSQSLNLKWLFTPHNEHQIVTTKLYFWLMLQWNSLNMHSVLLFNFFLYAAIAYLFAYLLESKFQIPAGITLIPFTTIITNQNISWGFQAQHHLCILFFLLSCLTIFQKYHLSPLLLVLSIFSFSYGILFSLAYITLNAFLWWETHKRKHIVYILVTIFTLILWLFLSHNKNSDSQLLSYPWQYQFWFYFLNLVSMAFGHIFQSKLLPGLAYFLSILLSFFYVWKTYCHNKEKRIHLYLISSLLAGVLLSLLILAYGRGNMYKISPEPFKVSRYGEIALPLFPILWAFIWLMIDNITSSIKRSIIIILLAGLLLYNLRKTFQYEVYALPQIERTVLMQCLSNHYLRSSKRACQDFEHFLTDDSLRNAQKLNLSFFKQLK